MHASYNFPIKKEKKKPFNSNSNKLIIMQLKETHTYTYGQGTPRKENSRVGHVCVLLPLSSLEGIIILQT